MLSDTQFAELLNKISMNHEDRALLIRIETIVKMNLENENRCRTDMFTKVDAAKASAAKAHERLDAEQKSRFILTGAIGSVLGVCSVVMLILKLTGHL